MAKRGPKSAEGKDVVRLNAVKHGLATAEVPLPGEDAATWEAFRAAIVEDAAPVGAIEEALAARAAELLWRLRRVAPYEAEVAATARERVPQDYRKRHGLSKFVSVEQAEVYAAAPRVAIAFLVEETGELRFLGEPATEAFEHALAESGAGRDIIDNDGAAWTRGTMRGAVMLLAKARGDPVKDVMAEVAEHLAAEAAESEEGLAYVLDEQDRMRRERALPPEQTLLNLSKYEAHLNRQLYQALHELEALQARRRGQPVPLARVQVSAGG